MKSQVINFRLNPKKSDDKRILDYLDEKGYDLWIQKRDDGRDITQTEVIKSVLLEAVDKAADKSDRQRQEQLRRQETENLVGQILEAVRTQIEELMQSHDAKMMTAILSAVAANQTVMGMAVPEGIGSVAEPSGEENEVQDVQDLQNLAAVPTDEDKPLDEDLKAGLAAMFG